MRHRRISLGYCILCLIMVIMIFITVYPFWHVVMHSISEPKRTFSGGMFFWPRGFSIDSYQLLFNDGKILSAYANSLFRLAVGTLINIVMTFSLAYPLSKKRFVGRGALSMLVFFTMLFGGGLIPSYMLINNLGINNTLWAVILPGSISAWNLFIMKNYFQGLPVELEESASMDGAGVITIMARIILPISMPLIASMTLMYGVGHWNNYFDANIYITAPEKQLLTQFLYKMVHSASYQGMQSGTVITSDITEESMKMATITVSVLPMLALYPFLQKYFVKGMMVGSIKG